MARQIKTLDGNEAVAHVAHRTNEVIAIYPITPSTPMGELSDAWSAECKVYYVFFSIQLPILCYIIFILHLNHQSKIHNNYI